MQRVVLSVWLVVIAYPRAHLSEWHTVVQSTPEYCITRLSADAAQLQSQVADANAEVKVSSRFDAVRPILSLHALSLLSV